MMSLPSPAEVKQKLPPSQKAKEFIHSARSQAASILQQEDSRLACIIGPCSIHDQKSALEYGDRLYRLSKAVNHTLFLVMRFFCEKPRTGLGWRGLLYDPNLNGSNDIIRGLYCTRELLLTLAEREVPCAAELLDPLTAPYYEDLITWGFIGARTSASPIHRQLASSLPFPIGFKNSIFGEISAAIHGIISARTPQSHLGINDTGHIALHQSSGNPLTHLVLRGSETQPNFDSKSIQQTLTTLKFHNLEPRILIDCSHGNSSRDHTRQPFVFESVLKENRNSLIGIMLESHLHAGKQVHSSNLQYGLSITDSCIGWDETEELLEPFKYSVT